MVFYSLSNKIKIFFTKLKWKRINKHNNTKISKNFPLDIVHVGKKTYGKRGRAFIDEVNNNNSCDVSYRA